MDDLKRVAYPYVPFSILSTVTVLMLKRIQEIKNIGRFKNCSAGKVEFAKMTVIYGLNTYGKSTLADLLSSIQSKNVVEAITKRKTISLDNSEQSVQSVTLSFQVEEENKEIPVKFKNGGWQHANLLGGLKLYVFDDNFLHKNLFVGKGFTRETKKNFNSLVLGESAIVKVREIEEKNGLKNKATRERNQLKENSFKDITVLDNFLLLEPQSSVDTLTKEIDLCRQKCDKLKERLKNAESLKKRPDLKPLEWKKHDFENALQQFNSVLGQSLQTCHEEAHRKVAEHIKNHFKGEQSAENWIRRGLETCQGEHCHFCGQVLGDDALQLLEIYRRYFDISYQKHDEEVQQQLARNQQLLTSERINTIEVAIANNNTAIANYSELNDNQTYLSCKEQITLFSSSLKELVGKWQNFQIPFKEQVETIAKKKKASPHVALESIQAEELVALNQQLTEIVDRYGEIILQLNGIFRDFKESSDDNSLSQQIKTIEEERKCKEKEQQRLLLSEQCETYKGLVSEIERLNREIPQLQKELDEEQSQFLDKFFERLNEAFKQFGSRNFVLEKCNDNRGHAPVYHLKIKFHETDIPEENLESVFSESDRRALALAVFWAKLEGLSDTEKRNAIVVLDDPVTSFDANRMTTTHQKIVAIANQVRQAIFLSHFKPDISFFLRTYKNDEQLKVKLLSIENKSNSSTIEEVDDEQFIKTEHEQKRDKIFKFISGETNNLDIGDLRIFLEKEIDLRFAKQIMKHEIREREFKKRLEKLQEKGIISDQVVESSQIWREILNVPHHEWSNNNVEDQRNTTAELVDFVYYRLSPKQ